MKRRGVSSMRVMGKFDFDATTGRPRIGFALDRGLHLPHTSAGLAALTERTLYYDIVESEDPKVVEEFVQRQRQEPIELPAMGPGFWAYRDRVVKDDGDSGGAPEETTLLVKHAVLRHETSLDRIRKEVQAMENLERVPGAQRERIPHEVRLFVWQRDEGKCALCGSRERLEFDHIIPVVQGGSNTERNVQLLCESCNRRKGGNL